MLSFHAERRKHRREQKELEERTPDGEGWVVRAWLQLTDDPDSYMILREDKNDASTESRISMPRNRQIVIDSQRLWHAAWHPGPEPRYALIVSFESGDALKNWIESQKL